MIDLGMGTMDEHTEDRANAEADSNVSNSNPDAKNVRAGIVTLYHKNHNYGGLLQAYALQRTLSILGAEAELLTLELPFSRIGSLRRKIAHYPIGRVIRSAFRLANSAFAHSYSADIQKKHDWEFDVFEQSIPHTESVNKSNYRDVASRYDILIAGSDQIWNPGVWEDCLLLYGLDSCEVRKISYAASLGCSSISESDYRYLGSRLASFDAVSVRESSGLGIIDRIYKGAQVVLDPTLLIPPEEWRNEFADNSLVPYDKRFAFIYLANKELLHLDTCVNSCLDSGLHCVVVPLDLRALDGASKYAKDRRIDILSCCSPAQWVGLIANASVVLTDSFHGMAFSLNLNTPFWCLPETGLVSKNGIKEDRRESLLLEVGLGNRMLHSGWQTEGIDLLDAEEDFDTAHKVISTLRNESIRFLQECLKDLA